MLTSLTPKRSDDTEEGLFRTILAGRFARTTEAFNNLRQSAYQANNIHGVGFNLFGKRVPVSDDPNEGRWELISIRDDIYVVVSDCNFSKCRTESVPPEDFIEFHFNLNGPASIEFSESGHMQVTTPNLTVVRQGDDMPYHVSCGPGSWRSVGLYVSRDYFTRFLGAAVPTDNKLWKELQSIGNQQVFCYQMPVSLDVLNVVEQLLNNPYDSFRRFLYAEAKAYEILCAAIDLWAAAIDSAATPEVFSARDLRLIEKAKDLIIADLGHVMTIPELARAVGTNTSKLKRGFKLLYGMTVFELGQRYRMNKALRLLVQDHLSVNEVAYATGYQHQTSFTAAFREYFGFTPKDAKRKVNVEELRRRGVLQLAE